MSKKASDTNRDREREGERGKQRCAFLSRLHDNY